MDKILRSLCVSLLVLGGLVGSADAYTATATFFYEGVDLELETDPIVQDPNILILVKEKYDPIEDILETELGGFTRFEARVDFYFEYDPVASAALFIPDPEDIEQMAVEDQGTLLGDATFDDPYSAGIDEGSVIFLLTTAGEYFKIDHFVLGMKHPDMDNWTVRFQVELAGEDYVIPEPSTLLLLSLGLLGLIGFGRWRKKIGRKIPFLLLATLLGVGMLLGSVEPVAAEDYKLCGDVDNPCPDVSQGETYRCWAAAASNALFWTEWKGTLSSGDDIFKEFKNNWTGDSEENSGGLMGYGWDWWFNGKDNMEQSLPNGPEWSKVTGGGGYYLNDQDTHFLAYYCYWGGWNTMPALQLYLRSGYGVTITAYPGHGELGHAFAVWGYIGNDNGNITHLWLTDSDDDPDQGLFKMPVTLGKGEDHIQWYLDSEPYKGWYIGGVMALRSEAPDQVLITALSVPASGIDPSGNVKVEKGADLTFTFPTLVYRTLKKLLIDEGEYNLANCTSSPPDNPVEDYCVVISSGYKKQWEYTFVNVNDDHTIQAIFDQGEGDWITASAGEDGKIIPSGDVEVYSENNVNFFIIPDPGYRIKEVLVDGESEGPISSYTLFVSGNHTIEARFAKNILKLAIVKKKCFNEKDEEISCEGVDATVSIGEETCGPDCGTISIPFSEASSLFLKFKTNDPEHVSLLRWQTADGTIVEGIVESQEDFLLHPVIRCSEH